MTYHFVLQELRSGIGVVLYHLEQHRELVSSLARRELTPHYQDMGIFAGLQSTSFRSHHFILCHVVLSLNTSILRAHISDSSQNLSIYNIYIHSCRMYKYMTL